MLLNLWQFKRCSVHSKISGRILMWLALLQELLLSLLKKARNVTFTRNLPFIWNTGFITDISLDFIEKQFTFPNKIVLRKQSLSGEFFYFDELQLPKRNLLSLNTANIHKLGFFTKICFLSFNLLLLKIDLCPPPYFSF